MSLDKVFILLVLTFSFDPKAKEEEGNFPMPGYLKIGPQCVLGVLCLTTDNINSVG